MLDRNQETRIKADEILKHKWLTKDNIEKEELNENLSLNLDTVHSNWSLKSAKTNKTVITPKSLINPANNKNYKSSNILSASRFQLKIFSLKIYF